MVGEKVAVFEGGSQWIGVIISHLHERRFSPC